MASRAPAESGKDPSIVMVTGGGRGIGRACALRFAHDGHPVALLARSQDELRKTAKEVEALGSACLPLVCDVCDEDSVKRAVQDCVARFSRVDILINNAGQARSTPLHKMSLAEWRGMLDVNLTGTFLVTREVLAGMLDRSFGRIINMASTAGMRGYKYTAHYCASKHGVVGLTRALAQEVTHRGVTVNAICPGWVETEMFDEAIRNISARTGTSQDDARKALLRDVPSGKPTAPQDVAELVYHVATHANLSGAILPVDGGQTA